MATMMAIINPGDEVVIFEPFYENYGPDAILSRRDAALRELRPPTTPDGDWTFDERELRPRFTTTPRRSSSTRRTTRPARCSRRASWN